MENHNIKIKLNYIYFMIYGSMACFFPYLTPLLKYKGYSYSKIGVIVALNSVISIVFQPIWGFVADRYGTKKKVIVLSAMASSLLIINLALSHNFLYTLIASSIFIVFQCPLGSVTDALCYDIIEGNRKFTFGRFRLMGSLGYALIAFSCGYVAKIYGVQWVFFLYTLVALLALLGYITLHPAKKKRSINISLKDVDVVFKNKAFMIFILAVLVSNITQGANSTYVSELLFKLHAPIEMVGVLWFVVAISEIPFMFFGHYFIKKYGVMNVFRTSLLLYSLRFLLDSLSANYIMAILLQLLQGITFAVFIISAYEYINIKTSSKIRTTSITIYSSLGAGLGALLGNLFGGIILQNTNIFFLYKVLSILSLVALTISMMIPNKTQEE